MLRKETKAQPEPKRVILRDTADPHLAENVSNISRPRTSDNPYHPPNPLSREERKDLKAHQIEVERQRYRALFYSRRNAFR